MKSLKFIPIIINRSTEEYTELRNQDNQLSDVLLTIGLCSIRVRTWFYNPSFIDHRQRFQKRFECYYDGALIDYSTNRSQILKTAKWLSA